MKIVEGVGKHWIELSNGFSQIFADKLVCLGFGNSLSSPFSVDRINSKYVVLFPLLRYLKFILQCLD